MASLWKSQFLNFMHLYSIMIIDGKIKHMLQLKLLDTFLPWQMSFHPNGTKQIVRFKGGLHNIAKSECTHFEYYSDGTISCLAYFDVDEKLHRVNGPAKITFYPNGNISCIEYYINGILHREDGPARTRYHENDKIYYETYNINGILHREDGPAYIEYRDNGNLFREMYYENGICHRKNGYAKIIYNGNLDIVDSDYYLNNEFYRTEEEYYAKVKELI